MSFKNATSQRLGKIQSVKTGENQISADTSLGKFKVTVYNPHVIRVAITRDDALEDFSYSVVASPESTKVNVQNSDDHLTIQTSALQLIIEKNPARFSFQTLEGKVINEDDVLGTSWIGEQVTQYKRLQDGERFLGLGEKTGNLDRRGHGYQNWNTDAYAYHAGTDPLYSSIPFYIGIHHHLCYGIFLDNSHKSFFNFGASNNRFSSFSADAGEMNYYFIYGNSVQEIIQHYTWLTGRMELPPQWSIGYQQCRYSYYPDKEVLTLAQTFRDKDIPSDVIVFDIHYMEKYKIFTWSEKDFPDPKGLLDQLKSMG